MIFNSEQIRDEWREHWVSKEEALRTRLMYNCERLESHAKELKPLSEGDTVLIQNQGSNSTRAKKWDRQGTIVAIGKNDQYLVKVSGTGRLTLRNHQFLRKFNGNNPLTKPLIHMADPNDSNKLLCPDQQDEKTCSQPLSGAASFNSLTCL